MADAHRPASEVWLTPDECAELLKLPNRRSVLRLYRLQKLPGSRIGKVVRFRKDRVLRVTAGRMDGNAPEASVRDTLRESIRYGVELTERRLANVPSLSGVYIVEAQTTRMIKIGYSSCIRKRVAALRNMSPDALTLIATIQGATPEDEAALHARFEHHRAHGEWFAPAREILEYALERALAGGVG